MKSWKRYAFLLDISRQKKEEDHSEKGQPELGKDDYQGARGSRGRWEAGCQKSHLYRASLSFFLRDKLKHSPFRLIDWFLVSLGLCCYAQALSSCSEQGLPSLWCASFSLLWLLSSWSTGARHAGFSSCGSWALECRLGSCGSQT